MQKERKPAALLWDLDGTIVDSEQYWVRAGHEIVSQYGVALSAEAKQGLIGKSLWESARVLREHGVTLPAADIVQGKANRVVELYQTAGVIWRPGARELLLAAREAGIPNVLVTMALRNVAEAVAAELPEGTFAAIFGGDDFPPGGGKPLPAPYLAGAAAVSADPGDCVVFEDSDTGLAAATSAGCVTIGVEHLLDLSGYQSHLVLDTLADVDIETVSTYFTKLRHLPPTRGGHSLSEV
ncbi:HAD family hydrolase [Canibacter zhoujuaniae]|uniref:HAD family hydrolase n=1 Tax=Canibacter zhoujuaniae TaxID=2708343 RepID=UPI00142000E3|nr:HAD family phosphatase [Canibacter zhoujuaniae]